MYNEEDILPHKRHGAIVKKALIKMTTDILKDKKKGFNDEIRDEIAVVQNIYQSSLTKSLWLPT